MQKTIDILNQLDKNLSFEILNKLDDKSLVSFCSTSKEGQSLCKNQTFWQRRSIDRFGKYLSLDTMKVFKADRSWSDYYIELSKKLRSEHPAYEAAKALEYGRKDIEELLRKTKGVEMEFIKDPEIEFYQDKNDEKLIPDSQGLFRTFENGKLETEGNMIDNKRIGKWTKYYNNGEVESVQNFKNGKLDGEQFRYKRNGELEIYEIWQNGVLLKRDKF